MIVKELINPKSIVIVGGSNDVTKPGGKVLKNIIDNNFNGKIFVVNPKEKTVQNQQCFATVDELPEVDLAIISISSKYVIDAVKTLGYKKNTKAFIVLSAGFSEVNDEGKILEKELVKIIKEINGSLIGPNCMGVLTPFYAGTFAGPVPKLDKNGCDFATGSGATAAFILENGIKMGLTFSSMFSVGNSALIGVEDIIKYWDENFDENSAKTKMIYMEKIDKPDVFLKHCQSLIKKGCKIAAIKSGTSEAGSRAASSHTGALASSDLSVDALFKKAGIVRCYGRDELVLAASVLQHKELKGKRIAVITHAGGPGVMITDELSKGGFEIPHIEGEKANELLSKLFAGSAVGNPIDFLATGTAEQLGIIIDYVDDYFENIDGMVVIFGSPGLFDVSDVYKVLNDKMNTAKKPIFPILPSIVTAGKEVDYFLSLGRIAFFDEVNFAKMLSKVCSTNAPVVQNEFIENINKKNLIKDIIHTSNNGYLPPEKVKQLLNAVDIETPKEEIAKCESCAVSKANIIGYPVVMKVIGPVHKSDLGGVYLNVKTDEEVKINFNKLMKIEGATSVLIQSMLKGIELFAGASYEEKFGHNILFGLGGIFIEVLKDFKYVLSPAFKDEIKENIKQLKSFKILEGVRGQEGINIDKFAQIIENLSMLLAYTPEIKEMDINPLLGTKDKIVAVDCRIKIEK